MPVARSMLRQLIGSTTPTEFFETYWERTPFVGHPGGDVCDKVLTQSDLDELLARNDLRFPTISLVKNGSNVPLSEYSRALRYGPYASEGWIDSDLVFRELNSGATVVCQLLQNSIPRCAAFVDSLGEELGFRVDCHAFITPKHSVGLSMHYDTTSAFILQISGKKAWQLGNPLIEAPTSTQRFEERAGLSFAQTEEIILEQGDCLYLPRGVPHQPRTTDSYSVHVTLALFSPTWMDLLHEGLTACSSHRLFRQAPRTDLDMGPEVQAELFQKFEASVLSTIKATSRTGLD